MFRSASLLTDIDDSDEPDIFGSASSSTGSGEIGGSNSSGTEGTLPRKYKVSYTWTGLPEDSDAKLPTEAKYLKDADVTVDTAYTNTTEIKVNDKTYTFSGWGTDDVEIKNNGTFAMPENDVKLTGTWTEKKDEKPDTPDNPEPDEAIYAVEWYEVGKDAPLKTDSRKGTVGEEVAVTESDKNFEGYSFDADNSENVLEATLEENGTVLKLYFTKNAEKPENSEKPETPEVPDPEKITVTWQSGYGDNAPIQTEEYDKGITEIPMEDYPDNPARDGYIFNGWGIPVVDRDGNITITALWRAEEPVPETYKVTVRYIYSDGSKAADDEVRGNLAEGAAYSITSPSISGYTPDQSVVSDTMGTSDIEITVTYTQNSTNSGSAPSTGNSGSGSGGSGSGNSGGGSGSSATNLRGQVQNSGTSEPAVTVSEDGVPLTAIPEGTDIVDEDVPLAGIPVADIPDAEVPLAEIPDFTTLDEENVPLARLPKTGDYSGLWQMMFLLSAFGLMAMSMLDKKKRGEKKQEM